ncbi:MULTISPECIES: GAF domain-containing protein [unclassified Streptomyces]|uniref:GAF domain-containing protein n=1 Tax=unclassified Streptomyces TaxID=2593676 RepID=UPI0030D0E68B
MSYDPPRPAGRLLLTPQDKDAPARVRRLRRLGLGERSEPMLDAFADRLAQIASAPYAMVNFIDEEQQFFAGLRTPYAGAGGGRLVAAADGNELELGRYMARDHGFCPHVVVRRKALVLEDVCDYPRFAGNPVVDEFGVRSYLGAPLLDRSGIALGTICVVDTGPRPWGRAGLETIKAMAAELTGQLEGREEAHGI